nr:formate dehydrogenase accessory sulfurtransferase FdhD [Inhella sp.]
MNAADLLAGACRVEVLAAQQGLRGPRPDWLAEERPVALVANGVSQAVMLATPAQLEDFARGFAFTEGWLERPADLRSVEAVAVGDGLELRIEVSAACEWRLKERRRLMAGRTGCGLCGAESLAQVRLPLPPLAAQPLSAGALERALAQLRESQPLQHLTGATHAAGWASRAGELLAVREDVG